MGIGAAPETSGGNPLTFEEMGFDPVLVTPSREVSVVIQQTIAAGGSGSVTTTLPTGKVDITRKFREAGDGSVSYRVEVDASGQVAVAEHRITGGERSFGRYWEKSVNIVVHYTNNDLSNTALLQLEWVSAQMDTAKWEAYRDILRARAALLGVQT